MKRQTLLLWVALLAMCVSLIGCGDVIGGTYTRVGNTATLFVENENVGTATVEGKTLTVSAVERTFTLTQTKVKDNKFTGIWVGNYPDGTPFEVAIGNTVFCMNPYGEDVAYAKFTHNGNTANLILEDEEIGIATLKGKQISATIEEETYVITKKANLPSGSCSFTKKNPFLGVWSGNVEGGDVEVVVGETLWGARLFTNQ